MASTPPVSHRFGRYETLFPIAAGGMAEVYAARQLGEGGFQKLVALKRMRPELAEDPRFVTMFLDEGRVAANIQSPNVVGTLDLGRADDSSLYLVMELVHGVSLDTILAGAQAEGTHIPVPIGVDIIAQAATGLHAAHEATSPTGEPLEIVHRDCSPHNILVDVQGVVKITDFGIAKAMERQTRSHAGEMKGKLSYLSPEQARGRPVDRRCDTFILGIVAWEVFAGHQLFRSDNPVEALHKVVTMPIPDLTEMNPEVTPAIARVVARALDRDPDARYVTTAAFGDALLDAFDGRMPPRTALAELVHRFGGETLEDVETGIREAMGKKLSEAPRPFEVGPIPGTHFTPRASQKTEPPPVADRTEPIPEAYRGQALSSSHPVVGSFAGHEEDEYAATIRNVDPEVIHAMADAAQARRTLALGGHADSQAGFSGAEAVHGVRAFPHTRKADPIPEPVRPPALHPEEPGLSPPPRRSVGAGAIGIGVLLVAVIGVSAATGVYLARGDATRPTPAATGSTSATEPAVTPVEVEATPTDDTDEAPTEAPSSEREAPEDEAAEDEAIDEDDDTPDEDDDTPDAVGPRRARPQRRPPVAHETSRRPPARATPPGGSPREIRDRTNAPRGDREVALDEIPW